MKDCLISKLFGEASSPNLYNLKSLGFVADGTYLAISSKAAVNIQSRGGNFTVNDSQTEITDYDLSAVSDPSDLTYFHFSSGTIIEVNSKYDLIGIQSDCSITLDDISMLNLQYIALTQGNMAALAQMTEIRVVNFANSEIIGDIGALANSPYLRKVLCQNSPIDGDITSIAGHTAVNTLNIYNSSIEGSIEGLVAARCDAGQTDGYIGTCEYLTSQLTIGGNKYNDYVRQLIWTSRTRMLLINATYESAATLIICKGCTAEEVAAWEASGKTVIVAD